MNSISREKLINSSKIRKSPRPKNFKILEIKKYNPETWSQIFYSKPRSKGLKLQILQGNLTKPLGTMSNVTNNFLGPKTIKIELHMK